MMNKLYFRYIAVTIEDMAYYVKDFSWTGIYSYQNRPKYDWHAIKPILFREL